MIRDKISFIKDYCSVIGNGPSVTNLSKEIDASFVMRCNNFVLTDKTGTRTDINISSLYNYATGGRKYPTLGVFPMHGSSYERYTGSVNMHHKWLSHADKLRQYGNQVWTYGIDDDYCRVFEAVAEEINAFPTTGLMGIATARWLGVSKILLSGFTFFKVGYDREVTKHHNPDAEVRLIRSWLTDEWILDELTKQVIYDN